MSSRSTITSTSEAAKGLRLCLSETEAAQALSVSTRTIFGLRSSGRLGFIKLGDGKQCRVLYPISELEKYIATNVQKTEVPL
jgi:excisionase family DNA binding protein